MMFETEAIILAGGNGSRMGTLSTETQKCLLPIDGKPTLLHIMDGLVQAYGSVDIKIAVAHKSEVVKEFVDRNRPHNANVTYVPHMPGTEGWGIYRDMREYVHGDFVATPGDIIADSDIYSEVMDLYHESGAPIAMSMSSDTEMVDTHGLGRIEDKRVTHLDWGESRLVKSAPGYLRDMTIWSAGAGVFNIIDEFPSPKQSIGVVFTKAFNTGILIAGNLYQGQWIHIGYPEDLNKKLQVHSLI